MAKLLVYQISRKIDLNYFDLILAELGGCYDC
jgi:hypothetical protein